MSASDSLPFCLPPGILVRESLFAQKCGLDGRQGTGTASWKDTSFLPGLLHGLYLGAVELLSSFVKSQALAQGKQHVPVALL